jgi:hypothetical protein
MIEKAVAAILFAGTFGIIFIVVGIRRMLQATKGKGTFDSILWGSIGILIGLGFLYGIYWMLTPPPDDRAPMPFDMHAHP